MIKKKGSDQLLKPLKGDAGTVIGTVEGIKTGVIDTIETAWSVAKGLVNFAEKPAESTQKAIDTTASVIKNAPEIAQNVIDADAINREKYATTLDLYQMQQDDYEKAKLEAQIYGELIGGASIGAVGKKATTETGKAIEEAIKNVDDHLTPKPAVVAGTPDINGGATSMTGNPDTNGGLGKTEVVGAAMAAGYDQPQNPQGIYDPQGQRADLEAVHGAENVSSTTVPKKPHQASATRSDVITDANGGKAVQITLKDGSSKMIPYDSRGLAIFDDVVVFTTKIDQTKSYSGQMSQASKDMWNVIKDDPVAQSKFTSKQLKALEAGRARVPGYTWHHNAQSSPNNMQLVPDSIHSNKTVPHTGQNSLTNSDR